MKEYTWEDLYPKRMYIPKRPWKCKLPFQMMFIDQINDVYELVKIEDRYVLMRMFNVKYENDAAFNNS